MERAYDRFLAALALAIFFTFMGIVAWYVKGWDLKAVLFLAGAMAAYDFWIDAFRPGPKGPNAPEEEPEDPSAFKDSI